MATARVQTIIYALWNSVDARRRRILYVFGAGICGVRKRRGLFFFDRIDFLYPLQLYTHDASLEAGSEPLVEQAVAEEDCAPGDADPEPEPHCC